MNVVIKGYSGRSCYTEWANVVVKGYSGRSCYRDWANVQCYKRVQWLQLLQRLGKYCYKRVQWLQLLQRTKECFSTENITTGGVI